MKPKPDYTDEYKFWDREDFNRTREDRDVPLKKHRSYVASNTSGAKKVLDFGAGEGRMFAAYTSADIVDACEVSTHRIKCLLGKAETCSFDLAITLISPDDTSLPYTDKFYDVVVASEVLLHIKPEKLIATMKELLRVGKKVVVISLYDFGNKAKPFDTPGTPCPDPARYGFRYDYPKICAQEGWKMENKVEWSRQIFFTYTD